MRVITALLILTVIILGAGFFTQMELHKTTTNLNSQIKILEKHIKEKNWEEAEKQFTLFKTKWEKMGDAWDLLVDHQERDEITISLARLEKYIHSRNSSLSLGEIGIVQELIIHIPEKEKLTIKNIL